MFAELKSHPPQSPAVIDERGRRLTYSELGKLTETLGRALPPRAVTFCFCENSPGSLIGYVGLLARNHAPLLLDRRMDGDLRRRLIEIYRPGFFWLPADMPDPIPGEEIIRLENYRLLQTQWPNPKVHDDLALLVSTSGSTGSPKLVRQSRRNLAENTRSIIEYLHIDSQHRPITSLPMSYVYGASVINTTLTAGGTLLMTDKSLMQKEFWAFFKEAKANSFAGVPYNYEILKKLRFFTMNLPSLRLLTQAGGKLLPELHREFAAYARDRGIHFVVMYGAAEATARMGYLPPEKSLEKCGAMGVPIPGGRFVLQDESGREISEPRQEGELIYFGPNVTLGYAENQADLLKGDERAGRLATGDMAIKDEEGYYYIVGRKKRFLKIFGNRVGLDETERLIKSKFPGLECAVGGRDDRMYIFLTDRAAADESLKFIARATGLHHSAFRVKVLESLPKNESGKILYARLEDHYDSI